MVAAKRTDEDGTSRQGARTRAKLLDAGMRVLGERGYHAARVDDVVRVAKVSHGTFYLYFSNKEALFRALAMQCAVDMEALAGSLGAVGRGEEGRIELRRWLAEFIATYDRYGVVIRSWMEDQVSDRELTRLGVRSFDAVSSSLVTRLQKARKRPKQQAEMSAAAMLAMVERFTYFRSARQVDFDDDTMLDTLAALVHRGFFEAA